MGDRLTFLAVLLTDKDNDKVERISSAEDDENLFAYNIDYIFRVYELRLMLALLHQQMMLMEFHKQ